jgi:hypothetical protein
MFESLLQNVALGAGVSLAGSRSRRNERRWHSREAEKSFGRSKEMLTLGNELDMANQKEMFDYRIQKGRDAGLTPFEMFLGPAGGAGGGTTGSGQTLGNQPGQMAEAKISARTQLAAQEQQQQTALLQTLMQTEAQKEVATIGAQATTGAAGISADANQYAAELNYKLKHKSLVLDTKRLENIDLPMAAYNMQKSLQETRLLINQVAANEREFLIMMKRLTMAAPNVLVEYAINEYGFNPLNKNEVRNATAQQKRNFLGLMLASQSNVAKEFAGSAYTAAAAANQTVDNVRSVLGEPFKDVRLDKPFGSMWPK